MASILIAEDEEALRGFVSRGLQLDGHRVDAARDGAEALDMLTEPGASYDLLLTDIRMPIMDGLTATRCLTEELPSIRVLILSGIDGPDAETQARAAGAAGFLSKYDGSLDLLGAIRTAAGPPPHAGVAP